MFLRLVASLRLNCFSGRHRSISANRKKLSKPQLIPTKASTNSENDIQFCKIKNEEEDCVLNFLRLHFYPHEPMTIGSEPKQQDPADEQFLLDNIPYGNCIMAVKTDGVGTEQVLAVAIAGPKDEHEAEHLFTEAAKVGPTKWGHNLQFIACVERDSNVYKKYNVTKALHIHAIAVDVAIRGKALGASLIKELMKLGTKNGFQVITADCTGLYSARLCERLGMECINVKFYKDYLDEKGNQVFHPPPPHNESVKTYAMRL